MARKNETPAGKAGARSDLFANGSLTSPNSGKHAAQFPNAREAALALLGGTYRLPKRLGRLQGFSRASVLSAGRSGLTAIETALAIGFDHHSIQSRLSELRRKGLIVDSGQRRLNPSGRRAIVWIAREYAIDDAQAPRS